MIEIIKRDATYVFNNSTLILRGTDTKELGDILADLLLLIPKKIKNVGYVSYGAYLQAVRVYKEIGEGILSLKTITISGHSLGAGVALIVAILLYSRGNYEGDVYIDCCGGIKVLSKKARNYLGARAKSTIWEFRYRDPVPVLGWFKEPLHSTPRSGSKKRWFLDFSIKEHVKYWG